MLVISVLPTLSPIGRTFWQEGWIGEYTSLVTSPVTSPSPGWLSSYDWPVSHDLGWLFVPWIGTGADRNSDQFESGLWPSGDKATSPPWGTGHRHSLGGTTGLNIHYLDQHTTDLRSCHFGSSCLARWQHSGGQSLASP